MNRKTAYLVGTIFLITGIITLTVIQINPIAAFVIGISGILIIIMGVKSNSKTTHFKIILERCDPNEIEMGRKIVTLEDHKWFAKQYHFCKNWTQRKAIVHLVQDNISETLRPIMLDALSAPDGMNNEGSQTHAIALCHLEGNLEKLEAYLNNPVLVKREAKNFL